MSATLGVLLVAALVQQASAWGWGSDDYDNDKDGYYYDYGYYGDGYYYDSYGYYDWSDGYYGDYYGWDGYYDWSDGYYNSNYYSWGDYYNWGGYYDGYYYDGYYSNWGEYYYYNNYYDFSSYGSCKGNCGDQDNDCYCDDFCLTYNDCCDDYLDECVSTVSAESCAGACGDESGSQGCYCDNLCDDYGDCCDDYETLCYTDEGCSVIDQVGWFYDSDTWETFWYGVGWYGWDTWNGNWVYDYGIWNYGWYDEVDCTFIDSFTFVGAGYCRGEDMNDQGEYDTIYVDALEICGAECIKDDDCMGIEWREEGACELHYGWVPSQIKGGNVDAECWAKSEYSDIEACNFFEMGWFFTGQYWETFSQGTGWIGFDTWNGKPVYDWGSWNLGWHTVTSKCTNTAITITAIENSKGIWEIDYDTTTPIEGFEIENCDLTDAYGGIAEEKDFYVTTGQTSGIVIAVSLEGKTISGSGELVDVVGDFGEQCEFIFSDADGQKIEYTLIIA